MNNKGQALIEFILIVPVLILIFLALVDIGNIFLKKYELNDNLETVATLYENKEMEKLNNFVNVQNITFKESKNNDLINLTVTKNVKVSAPILSNVLGKKFKIEASKNIYSEEAHG